MAALTPAKPPQPPQQLASNDVRDAAIYYLILQHNALIDWANEVRHICRARSIPIPTPPAKIT
jgi:hypothetical protein